MTDVLIDLDGVLYRGRQPIAGASEGLASLREAGHRLLFITNNSTKTPRDVAAKITAMTGELAASDDVLTSAMAAIHMLEESEREVVVVGETGIETAVRRSGRAVTESWSDAHAVIVGLDRSLSYRKLELATRAIGNGARFIATNLDPTYPTESGLLPGSGSIVASVATAAGIEPEVAGKPSDTMVRLIRDRGVGPAFVIGDRLDTDVALGAEQPDWTTVVVLTGVTSAEDAEGSAVDHVAPDFRAAAEMVIHYGKQP